MQLGHVSKERSRVASTCGNTPNKKHKALMGSSINIFPDVAEAISIPHFPYLHMHTQIHCSLERRAFTLLR